VGQELVEESVWPTGELDNRTLGFLFHVQALHFHAYVMLFRVLAFAFCVCVVF
jgi:hypothetical protein